MLFSFPLSRLSRGKAGIRGEVLSQSPAFTPSRLLDRSDEQAMRHDAARALRDQN